MEDSTVPRATRNTIECTLREPSIVTNEETEQADVPQNEHPPVFLSYRKLRFHTIRNAPRGSHCSGMEECRLRDPPQAENPASQDSFLSYRKLRFYTIKTLREDRTAAEW